MEIPEPEGLAKTDSWCRRLGVLLAPISTSVARRKATATRKTSGEATISTVYTYTITHADGTATLRTVTNEDGKTATEEKRVRRFVASTLRRPRGRWTRRLPTPRAGPPNDP